MKKPIKTSKEHIYKIKYKIVGGKFSKKQLENNSKDWGACDALLLTSIVYPEDGSLSVLFIPLDGRKLKNKNPEPLEDNELFKIWYLLASRLSNSKVLSDEKKEFCKLTFDLISKAVINKNNKLN